MTPLKGLQGQQDLRRRRYPAAGGIRFKVIPDTLKATLHDFIAHTVKDEAEAIYTDDLAATSALPTTTPATKR